MTAHTWAPTRQTMQIASVPRVAITRGPKERCRPLCICLVPLLLYPNMRCATARNVWLHHMQRDATVVPPIPYRMKPAWLSALSRAHSFDHDHHQEEHER